MKSLLTSAGLQNKKVLEFFVSLLPKKPQDISVLMIEYSQNKEEQFYVDESKRELVDVGIKNITTFNLGKERFSDQNTFDVIYVCGGNTFAILDRIRKTSIGEYIFEKVKNNESIYFGVSAGSIIAGPNISTAGWGSEADGNFVGLKDLNGLQFTHVSILPHFKERYASELEALKSKVDYPVIGLTDDQAIFVDDSGYKII